MIKRYKIQANNVGGICEFGNRNGEWVKFKDAASLQTKLEQAENLAHEYGAQVSKIVKTSMKRFANYENQIAALTAENERLIAAINHCIAAAGNPISGDEGCRNIIKIGKKALEVGKP